VATLFAASAPAGDTEVEAELAFPPGVYVVSLQAGGEVATEKVVIVR